MPAKKLQTQTLNRAQCRISLKKHLPLNFSKYYPKTCFAKVDRSSQNLLSSHLAAILDFADGVRLQVMSEG